MKYHVTVDGRTVEVELEPGGVRVNGQSIDADLERLPDTPIHNLVLDGRSHRFVCTADGRGVWELHLKGRKVRARIVDERTRAILEMTGRGGAPAGPEPVRAPMPGLVVRIQVEEGQEVAPGDGLAVVEAMKMENELRAEVSGRIRSVRVSEGQSVEKDEVLMEFEPPEEG